MGFLDKVTKGITDTVDGISKAVSDATANSTSTATPTGAPVARDGSWSLDMADPASWLTPEQVDGAVGFDGAVEGTFHSPPDAFERDDAAVARFVSDDGHYTVDLAFLTESYLARFVSFEAVIESAKADLVQWEDSTAGDFELAIGGSTGDGHARFIGCAGDTIGQVDIYGPAGGAYVDPAHNLLFVAFHMDEE
jgi:hypothetical protein